MGAKFLTGAVYGAYANLFSVSKENIAASATALEILEISIPADEDWIIMKVQAYCDVQGNAGDVDVEDDGNSILSADAVLVSDGVVVAAVVATGGEKGALFLGGCRVH